MTSCSGKFNRMVGSVGVDLGTGRWMLLITCGHLLRQTHSVKLFDVSSASDAPAPSTGRGDGSTSLTHRNQVAPMTSARDDQLIVPPTRGTNVW